MKKIIGILLVMALFLALPISHSYAAKDSGLKVEAKIGIDNRVKDQQSALLKIKITNDGEDFSGDFVVDSNITYSAGVGLVYPLDIASGETKTLNIYLDSFSEMYIQSNNYQQFKFFKGGIEKNNELAYTGDKRVIPKIAYELSKMVLVLTSREDLVKDLDDLKKATQEEMYVFYDTKDSAYLTDDVKGIKMLDMIVFDDVAFQDLTAEQREAIKQWVNMGGKVVFTTDDFALAGAGDFKTSLPFTFEDETIAIDGVTLKNYSNDDSVMATYQKATLNEDAQISLAFNDQPIAAYKSLGNGMIVQLAFPLTETSINTLSGYGNLLMSALKIDMNKATLTSNSAVASEWTYFNELFDTFKNNVWILLAGLIIYIAIIGPILYSLLKRKDRREKMWIIVPVIAIVSSLAIFVFGAKDRLTSPQVQQVALYEMNDTGSLNGMFVNSILSNKSGDFTLTMDDNTYAALSNSYSDSDAGLYKKAYLKSSSEGKELVMKDFGYWSVKSVIGGTYIEDAGTLKTDLILEDGFIKGTLTNTFAINLNDVKILVGRDSIDLGDVKAGETVQINKETKKTVLAAPYLDYNYGYYSNNQRDLAEERWETVKNGAISLYSKNNRPMIIASADISIASVKLKKGSKQKSVSYFAKEITVPVTSTSDISYTENDGVPSIEAKDYNDYGYETEKNNAFLIGSEFYVSYPLFSTEDIGEVDWKELSVSYNNENYELSLVNKDTNVEYEFTKEKEKVTNDISEYIDESGYITFMVRPHNKDGIDVQLPKFTLKGALKK